MSDQWGRKIWESLIASVGGVVENPTDTTKRTEIVGDIIYMGRAKPGALDSDPVWLISRLNIEDDGQYPRLYPDGIASFTNVWNDRATLTYL